MLIYVPATSRAGIAALICLVAVANLNYFQPHKNKVIFWLSQISFVTTASKYIVALLLSASIGQNDMRIIGSSLVGLDIFFMVSSIFAVVISVMMLRSKIMIIQQQSKDKRSSAVKVQPSMVTDGGGFNEENSDDVRNWGMCEEQSAVSGKGLGKKCSNGNKKVKVEQTKVRSANDSMKLDICQPRKMFEIFDQNKDGALDRAEVLDALQTVGCSMKKEAFEAMFLECDKNKDGVIDYPEFKKHV